MQYVRFDLDGKYREIGSQVAGLSATGAGKEFRMDHFLEWVDWVGRTASISHVLLIRKSGFALPAGGALENIFSAVKSLRKAGKKVLYYAVEYTMVDCVLASACDERIIHPRGYVHGRGLAVQGLFFRSFLEKNSIDVEIIRRGRYKSAGDAFLNDTYDQWNQAQLQQLLDSFMAVFQDMLISSGGFDSALIQQLLEGKIFTAADAQKQTIVHKLETLAGLLEEFRVKKIKLRKKPKIRGAWGKGKRIALLVFEGSIIDGSSRRSPLYGQMVGDESFTAEIDRLRRDSSVAAVVLRINSGGGSPSASDSILRALQHLDAEKPLVVSMGPTAASGGYWMAMVGRRLFAHKTTVTGSIGVFSLFFRLDALLAKYGITTDRIVHGEHADIGSALRPMTEKERMLLDSQVEQIYQDFLQLVAQARKKTVEQVHSLGEGRIYSGLQACQHALVDSCGSLQDAIGHAAQLAGIGSNKDGSIRARITVGPQIKQSWLVKKLSQGSSVYIPDIAHAQIAEDLFALHSRPLLVSPSVSSFSIQTLTALAQSLERLYALRDGTTR